MICLLKKTGTFWFWSELSPFPCLTLRTFLPSRSKGWKCYFTSTQRHITHKIINILMRVRNEKKSCVIIGVEVWKEDRRTAGAIFIGFHINTLSVCERGCLSSTCLLCGVCAGVDLCKRPLTQLLFSALATGI